MGFSHHIGQVVTVHDWMIKAHLSPISIYRPLITKEEDGEEVDAHLNVHIPPVQQQTVVFCNSFCTAHSSKSQSNSNHSGAHALMVRNHYMSHNLKLHPIPHIGTIMDKWVTVSILMTQNLSM